MPVTTRSQAAAAAAARPRRDLEPRRGVSARRHVRTAAALAENAAPSPAEASSASIRSRKTRRAAADVVAKPPDEVKKAAAGARHISSLCDDLLLEIFLHLPSVATLIRAACTCTSWRRAMVSSPDFRRRFRALHPAPLLGLFTSDAASIVAGSPTFVPIFPHGWDDDDDLAAAVRGSDFSLASLPAGGWRVLSNTCRLGNLLVYNMEHKSLAAINPMNSEGEGRRRVLDVASRNTQGAVLSSSEESSSSSSSSRRVMLVDHAGTKMKATIYSMDTCEVCWVTPWVDVPACPDREEGHVPHGAAVELNGSVYYVLENYGYIVSIDTTTMEFSAIELPQCVSRKSLGVGETKDGTACLVYSDGLEVGVLMLTRDDGDGTQKWVLDKVLSMDAELQRLLPGSQFHVLRVFALRDGYVYLSTSVTLQDHYWLLSLCLGTMKLEKLFQGTYDGRRWIPYIMPWPRSLIDW